jgi:hypothetical protein
MKFKIKLEENTRQLSFCVFCSSMKIRIDKTYFPVLKYGSATWTLTMREAFKLQVSGKPESELLGFQTLSIVRYSKD